MAIAGILSVTMILFSVIDIIGSLPIILDLKKRGVTIQATTATLTAGILMIAFLFFGVAMQQIPDDVAWRGTFIVGVALLAFIVLRRVFPKRRDLWLQRGLAHRVRLPARATTATTATSTCITLRLAASVGLR